MGYSFSRESPTNELDAPADIRHLYSKVRTDDDIEKAIAALLKLMTQQEKVGQLTQTSYGEKELSPEMQNNIINGLVGSFLNCNGIEIINQMQKLTM
jgi:beta-glucosidase